MKKPLAPILVLSLIGALSLAATPPAGAVLANGKDVLSAKKFATCTGYCVVCQGGSGGHNADVAPPDCVDCLNKNAAEGTGWHTVCANYSDCADHACAEESPAPEQIALPADSLFNRVTVAVLNDDYHALRGLLASNPNRFHFLASRGAVQITACDGAVIAHYPLRLSSIAALTE